MSTVLTRVADGVLLLHGLFVAFVVLGELGVIAGGLLGWRWVRNRTFRWAHLMAIGIVIGLAWANLACPLTAWENALRKAGGESPYAGSFIQHWVGRCLYYDGPPWVFTAAYTAFGALVIASWIWVRPGLAPRGAEIGRGRETRAQQ